MPPVTPSMIYQAYRTQAAYLDLVRPLAAAAGTALRLPWPRLGQDWPLHTLAGVLETFANLTVSHARLPFGIDSGTSRHSTRFSDGGGGLFRALRHAASLQEGNRSGPASGSLG